MLDQFLITLLDPNFCSIFCSLATFYLYVAYSHRYCGFLRTRHRTNPLLDVQSVMLSFIMLMNCGLVIIDRIFYLPRVHNNLLWTLDNVT